MPDLVHSTGIVILAGAISGGIVSGIAGFGGGPIILAAWLLVLTPQQATPLLTVTFLWVMMFNIHMVRHAISWARLMPYLIGGLIGVPAGALLLEVVSPITFRRIVGGFLIAYAVMRLTVLGTLRLRTRSRVPDALAAAASGVVAGLAGTPGPPISLWCGLRGWGKDEQRAVVAPFNLLCTVAAIVAYVRAGLVTVDTGWLALWAVPGAVLGNQLGIPIYRRMSDTQFQGMMVWLLLAMGVLLVV